MWRKRLTSTVNSLIEAIVAVSGSVAEFVEVNTFLRSDALHVVERTADHNFMCAYRKNKKRAWERVLWMLIETISTCTQFTVISKYKIIFFFFFLICLRHRAASTVLTEVQRSNRADHHFHRLQFSRVNSCIGCCCYSGPPSFGGGRIFTYAVSNLQPCFLRKTDVRQQRRRSPMTNCSAPPASLGTGGEQLLKDSWDGNVPSFTWQPGEHIKPSWPVHQYCKCATSPPYPH